MSEKTASEVIKQIYEHLKRTNHLDVERQTALDMACKALNRNNTDLIESCIEEIRRLGVGEIEVNTTTKDGYLVSVKVEKY